jgi:hypothetical protein
MVDDLPWSFCFAMVPAGTGKDTIQLTILREFAEKRKERGLGINAAVVVACAA